MGELDESFERRAIFRCDRDRCAFLDRLADLVLKSDAGFYAWALMPNHAHLLLRTGSLPLSRLARRWLGPYATSFNRVHRRAGHLFQNRFKNTLVEEAPYLLELVRYIHLNPVRSRLPVTIESLDTYPWTGHSVLLGNGVLPAQSTDFVLEQFGPALGKARNAYREFVREGAVGENSPDLEGGGLRRSAGGWELVPRLHHGRERWVADERILGSSNFVREVLQKFSEDLIPRSIPCADALLTTLCETTATHFAVTSAELASSSLRRPVLAARAVVSYVAVRDHKLGQSAVARHLGVSHKSVARGLERAPSVFAAYGCSPADFRIA